MEEIGLIVGLGNPGPEYAGTRHNAGFMVIDRLLAGFPAGRFEERHTASSNVWAGRFRGRALLLQKPLTFMNLSGESIREIVDYYKVDDTTELIVISDDISLDVGQLRIRKKGSAGGHNGLKNIIKMLGHDTFTRVRMGVGEKPKNYDLADYVLGHFPSEERTVMDEAAKTAAEAIRMILTESADAAMNHFNSKKA